MGVSLPGPFLWRGQIYQHIRRLVRSRCLVGNELAGGVGKGRVHSSSVVPEEAFLKWEVCVSHIYPIFLYRLSVLPHPYAILMQLGSYPPCVADKAPKVCPEIRYFHPSKDDLGMSSVEIPQHTLRVAFLDRMCLQADRNGEFWKDDACKNFPSLRSVREGGPSFILK